MKGQIKQVFVYAMSIIVIGFVMLIAIRSFSRINDSRCSAEQITFQRELLKELEENYVWGREKYLEMSRPCDFEVVCFVDARTIRNEYAIGDRQLTNLRSGAAGLNLKDNNQYDQNIIIDSVQDGIMKNLFLIKPNYVEPLGYNEKLALDTEICGEGHGGITIDCETIMEGGTPINIPKYAFCVPQSGGKFMFKLEGQGRMVVVKQNE